jgi:protein gp37
MGRTKIEWTATYHPDGTVTPGYTFNPWIGCQKIGDGCKFCYAERDFARKPRWTNCWGPPETSERKRTSEANWHKPLAWNRQAQADGIHAKVFCASLCDVFEDNPQVAVWRTELFEDIIYETPWLQWLILTKRPQRMFEFFYDRLEMLRKNIWLGVSVENQAAAGERREYLRRCPAAVKFVSYEPALGPVDWTGWEFVDWIISGGESGPKARPSHPDWHRRTRDWCQKHKIAYFFKQWGEWWPVREAKGYDVMNDLETAHRPVTELAAGSPPMAGRVAELRRIGKRAAGRLLDGRTWDEMPEIGE